MTAYPDILAAALLGLVGAAVVWDLRERRIPNGLTIGAALAALALRAPAGGDAVLAGLAGLGLGFLAALPFFALGGLGGGDVKLLAAVGAFLGPGPLPVALLATALAGGALALGVVVWRGRTRETLGDAADLVAGLFRRDRRPRKTLETPGALAIPYAVPIAAGALAGILL